MEPLKISTTIIETLIEDIIDSLFWYKDRACPTPTDSMLLVNDAMDSRLQYWRTYLAERQRIAKRIKKATGKTDCELLFNQIHENRDVTQLKRILDFSERLNPTNLARKELDKLKELPCRGDVFETQAMSELRREYCPVGIVGVPQLVREEENVLGCPEARKGGWLESRYLGRKFTKNAEQLKTLLQFYPKIDELQVGGKAIVKARVASREESSDLELSFKQSEVKEEEQEPQEEYFLMINEVKVSLADPPAKSIRFNNVFEEQHTSILVTIENLGTRVVDFEWLPFEPILAKCLKNAQRPRPAFFFDKNSFRVLPTQKKEVSLIFRPQSAGIYSEKWQLNTHPKLMPNDLKIVFNIFGHSEPPMEMKDTFERIEAELKTDANADMSKEILKWLAMHSVPDLPTEPHAFAKQFTEIEIFRSLNPSFNCSESLLDELKGIYTSIRKLSACAAWNFNLADLKQLIVAVEEDNARRELYSQFVDILERMRRSKYVEGKEQLQNRKLLLVRNVFSATFDKLEAVISDLEASLAVTNLDVSFNEVVIFNPYKVPNEMKLPTSVDEDRKSELSFCVVKSKPVKRKKRDLVGNVLYVQFYSRLLQAFDEAVCVVEGVHFE